MVYFRSQLTCFAKSIGFFASLVGDFSLSSIRSTLSV